MLRSAVGDYTHILTATVYKLYGGFLVAKGHLQQYRW